MKPFGQWLNDCKPKAVEESKSFDSQYDKPAGQIYRVRRISADLLGHWDESIGAFGEWVYPCFGCGHIIIVHDPETFVKEDHWCSSCHTIHFP